MCSLGIIYALRNGIKIMLGCTTFTATFLEFLFARQNNYFVPSCETKPFPRLCKSGWVPSIPQIIAVLAVLFDRSFPQPLVCNPIDLNVCPQQHLCKFMDGTGTAQMPWRAYSGIQDIYYSWWCMRWKGSRTQAEFVQLAVRNLLANWAHWVGKSVW